MGAHISARRGDTLPPIVVKGGELQGIAYESPVASAQVKSAILLAGLYAAGETAVTEPQASRDHTERMLRAMGADIRTEGTRVNVRPAASLRPLSLRVPGDISSAAPWLVLGACHPDAEILVTGVNTNPTRTGILTIMQKMGADVTVLEEREFGGEPVADMLVRSSKLRGVDIGGALIPLAIDELPLVGLLACFADGPTTVRDAAELRAKESDRVEAVVRVLGRFGAKVTPAPEGFTVTPPAGGLQGTRVDGGGDHRIGMLGGIAGALATGETRVDNDAAAVSYPEFWSVLAGATGA
jgi:3-phosphoshikimate 1-carboxyvinyltransferase